MVQDNSLSHRLISQLTEIYQPIFGHPEYSSEISRHSRDILTEVLSVYQLLKNYLKRPLRILDLGCNLGYFSFNLAKNGAIVYGIDYSKENIALCKAISEENPNLSITFQNERIEKFINNMDNEEYDLVLGLSVFHHLIYEYGLGYVKKLITTLSTKVNTAIYEFALRNEPLYWADLQPQDVRELIYHYDYIHLIGKNYTHLSEIKRPLYFTSNKYWYVDGMLGFIDKFFTDPHDLAQNTHQGTRRYYFSDDLFIKQYRIDSERKHLNIQEYTQEVNFLKAPPAGYNCTELKFFGKNEHYVWLGQKKINGELLLKAIDNNVNLNIDETIMQILKHLSILEKVGLYHNDVRVWNVIIQPDHKLHLIDYGSISQQMEDCQWPTNIFFAFFLFVYEVTNRIISAPIPVRKPFISPENLPEPYKSWAKNLWTIPSSEWSFNKFYSTFQGLFSSNDL